MKPIAMKTVKSLVFAAIGLAVAALGIYIGETDDAPGAAVIGLVMMIGMMALAARTFSHPIVPRI